ncbi:hypothetical protein D3C80_1830740 [compost metagenome]
MRQPARGHQPLAGPGQLQAVAPVPLTHLHEAFGHRPLNGTKQRLQHIGLAFINAPHPCQVQGLGTNA